MIRVVACDICGKTVKSSCISGDGIPFAELIIRETVAVDMLAKPHYFCLQQAHVCSKKCFVSWIESILELNRDNLRD